MLCYTQLRKRLKRESVNHFLREFLKGNQEREMSRAARPSTKIGARRWPQPKVWQTRSQRNYSLLKQDSFAPMRGTGRKPRSTRVQDLRVALSCITRSCLSLLERTSIGRKRLTTASYQKCPFYNDERREEYVKRDPVPKVGAGGQVH